MRNPGVAGISTKGIATAKPMAQIPQAGVEETDAAVARAKAAFPVWREVTPADRARLIHRLADALEGEHEQLARLDPEYIVSANVGCIHHLQSGTSIPVKHWIEVLDEALLPAARAPGANGAN